MGESAIPVLSSVFIPQEGYIDVRGAHLGEVDRVGTPVGCGKVFEEENIEEPAQQGITPEVRLERLPFVSISFCTELTNTFRRIISGGTPASKL